MRLKWKTLVLGALLLPIFWLVPAESSASMPELEVTVDALATNCLSPVGRPYESGDNVYIKVKNNCRVAVGFTWEVGTYNYGVYGSPIGTPKTGTRAVKPGKTTTICAKKPADRGRYCFRFKIKSKDQTKPNDEFVRWAQQYRGGDASRRDGRWNFRSGR